MRSFAAELSAAGIQKFLILQWRKRSQQERVDVNRPVHIHTLLLGAFSPLQDEEFLYASSGEFRGEGAHILDAVGISPVRASGKTREVLHAEFQRAGFFLTHVLECPFEDNGTLQAGAQTMLKKRLTAVATRIRRSLKPKRVMAVTEEL